MCLFAVVEGDTDEPVVRKLANDARLRIEHVFDMGGKGQLDKLLKNFNSSAKGSPWFVLRDLDHDSDCAPSYLRDVRLRPATWMIFRLAVREIEAWLLADHEGLAEYLGVSPSRIPARPDELDDPTQTLVNLARRSRRSGIIHAFVPRQGDSVVVGPGYEAGIIDFGRERWDLNSACKRSPSLQGARDALHRLAERWSRYIRGGAA
jgi:hypothetical protein